MPDSDGRLLISATSPQRSFVAATAPHPWPIAAGEFEVWDRLPVRRGTETIRTTTLAVVEKLATAWENDRTSLAHDPWFDDGFADVFAERVNWTIGHVLRAEDLELSAAEVSLLVTFPYLHQAFWARQAAQLLRGTDPAAVAFGNGSELSLFRAFAAEHGALHRRGTRAIEMDDPAGAGIGWWLFHHWLVRQPDCYQQATIAALLPPTLAPPVNSVLTPARLIELMRVVQIDAAFLRRTDRHQRLTPSVRIAGGTTLEQVVREQLVGYLLVFAHRTAIDPATLPRVVVDHVGINDGIAPEEVLESIRTAWWDGTRTRVLVAKCTHPATVLALRRQAAAVDAVLTEIVGAAEESPQLEPLRNMPTHASADRVGTAADEDGTAPTPTALGHRFRLADDRIQELLMGEQLYGTPELAIRELYQNALDACRYREARTEYLRRTAGGSSSWTGRIGFRHDVDEHGRPFLECADNGIGMGDRELVDVFSRAGVRFADMPEYVEEQAHWTAEGIESYPNSRFGIGVLSYFMLADEITVTTCRLDREGNAGRRLEVHVAGPGALFRVRDLGDGDDAGTVIRLWLRPADTPLRCTELLRRILWVSDYHVSSDDVSGRQTWEPHQLSPTAPIGSDALDEDARRTASRVVPTQDADVWWCDTKGAVLSDGIWAGTALFGAVVNLTGRDLPRLTIDRKAIIDLDQPLVEERMRAAIPALMDGAHSPLSHEWLSTLVTDMPRLADEICERAIEVRYRPWRIAGTEMPIETVGCFPDDKHALLLERIHRPGWNSRTGRWRLNAWLHANPHPELQASTAVIPARPSDGILLEIQSDSIGLTQWLPDSTPPHLGDVLAGAVRAHRSPGEVAQRLAALGYAAPDPERLPSEARRTDPLLLSEYRNGLAPWLKEDRPVPHHHVILAAVESGLAPHTVVERLAELGYETPPIDQIPAVVHPGDKKLLLGDARYSSRLDVSHEVPFAHIMITAAATGRTPREVARRLGELGFSTPDPESLPPDHDSCDKAVFTGLWGGHVSGPVPVRHISVAAIESGRSPAMVTERLARAGYEVPAIDDLPDSVAEPDAVLIRTQNLAQSGHSNIHPDSAVGLGDVVCAAIKTAQTPAAVAQRLAELGYTPPPADQLPEEVTPDDMILLSTTIGSDRGSTVHGLTRPWLAPGRQVHPQRIFIAAAKTGRSPRSVADRMKELGLHTPPDALLDADADPDDVFLLSVGLDRLPPWLEVDHPALMRSGLRLPHGHVLAAAAYLDRPPSVVAARLELLGLRTEDVDLPANVDPLAIQLLNRAVTLWRWSSEHRDQLPWLDAGTTVGTRHLVITAARTGLPPTDVARRLTALGFTVDDARELPRSIDQGDLILLSQGFDGQEPFRQSGAEFEAGLLPRAASTTELPHREVIDRLLRLGFTIGS